MYSYEGAKILYHDFHTCPSESAILHWAVTWRLHLVTDCIGLPSTDCNNCMLITKDNFNTVCP
jgi:hypothetical protein